MTEPVLHLVKVSLRVPSLMRIARKRRIRPREIDEGYLVHSLFRELWQERAPSPYLLRGSGRQIDAWGYTKVEAQELREHARSFGDPSSVALLEIDDLYSRPMPRFEPGRRLGFHLRACPVSRQGRKRNGESRPLERDVFLARVEHAGAGVSVSREEVYRNWLLARLTPERIGARVDSVRVDSFSRERITRLTEKRAGEVRRARVLERPDVYFSGDLVVEDTRRLRNALENGVGRHKAFGFGMLLIVPPGSRWSPPGTRSYAKC